MVREGPVCVEISAEWQAPHPAPGTWAEGKEEELTQQCETAPAGSDTQQMHGKGTASVLPPTCNQPAAPQARRLWTVLLRHASPLLRHAVLSPRRNVVVAHNVVVGTKLVRAKAAVCSRRGGCMRSDYASEAVRHMGWALRQLALP